MTYDRRLALAEAARDLALAEVLRLRQQLAACKCHGGTSDDPPAAGLPGSAAVAAAPREPQSAPEAAPASAPIAAPVSEPTARTANSASAGRSPLAGLLPGAVLRAKLHEAERAEREQAEAEAEAETKGKAKPVRVPYPELLEAWNSIAVPIGFPSRKAIGSDTVRQKIRKRWQETNPNSGEPKGSVEYWAKVFNELRSAGWLKEHRLKSTSFDWVFGNNPNKLAIDELLLLGKYRGDDAARSERGGSGVEVGDGTV